MLFRSRIVQKHAAGHCVHLFLCTIGEDTLLFLSLIHIYLGELLDRLFDADALGLAAEGRERVAVALIGVDEVAETGHRLVILIEKALVRGAVGREVLEDGQGIRAVLVDDARDARGVVGRVRLELAGAQGVDIALALAQVVADRVGLVAVGDDQLCLLYTSGRTPPARRSRCSRRRRGAAGWRASPASPETG